MQEGIDKIDVAITICDADWIISYMNEKSVDTFSSYGGEKLIGTNLLDCHNDNSRSKLLEMKENNEANTYTIEKNGKLKLIHQAPFSANGEFNGFVELSIELPKDMPHFKRS